MSNKLNILESKKLFKEFNYLSSDIEFKNEFAREYGKGFEKALRKLLREEPIFKQACKDKFGLNFSGATVSNIEPSKSPSKGPSKEPNNNLDVVIFTGSTISHEPIIKLGKDDQKLKHLYRKIVQLTHPDKIKSDALNELYVKAVDANKSGDILTIYSICNELGIKFNISDKEILILKRQIMLIKKQQSGFETSHLWLWVHAENPNKKLKLIKHFLLHNAPTVAVLFN